MTQLYLQDLTLPAGFEWCLSQPFGVEALTEPEDVSGTFGWQYVILRDIVTGKTVYEYRYDDGVTQEIVWACQSSDVVVTTVKDQIKQIQLALKNQGYDPGVIDGIWGPNTCGAAYKFKQTMLNSTTSELGADFFNALGLGNKSFEIKFKSSCVPWYATGPVNGKTNGNGEIIPEPQPVVLKPPIPGWLIIAMGITSGGLIGYAAKKKSSSALVGSTIGLVAAALVNQYAIKPKAVQSVTAGLGWITARRMR